MKKFRNLAIAVCTGALLTLLSAATLAAAATPPPLPRDSVYQLPLTLTNQAGQASDWRLRRGKPQLVSMFYTSCKYICPLIVDSGKAIEKNLTPAQQQQLGILLISMDPARDDAAALKAIVDKRNLDTQRWTLSAPPAADVRTVAGVLGIRFRQLADGEFNHTSALVLLDKDGRILARTEQVGTRPDPEFLAAVRKATQP
ncbi:SCO family protein [Lysobacter rhizosphaerae]